MSKIKISILKEQSGGMRRRPSSKVFGDNRDQKLIGMANALDEFNNTIRQVASKAQESNKNLSADGGKTDAAVSTANPQKNAEGESGCFEKWWSNS